MARSHRDARRPVGREPGYSARVMHPAAPSPSPDAAEIPRIRRRGISVGLATGLYGLSFGALATSSGLDVWQAVVLSAVLFSGGSQFAFIGVVSGGGSALGAVLASALLGIRNTVYGVALARTLPGGGARGALRALLTIDESVATALSGTTPEARRAGFWSAGISVWIFWNLFSLIGAVAGAFIADPRSWGLDGAAAAAFLALLWPRLARRDVVAIAVAAGFVATLTTPLLPAGLPVLAAACVAVVVGVLGRAEDTA